MNKQFIADLSRDLLIKYYDNDYMSFLNHMDDNGLWYGPYEGQFIRGRDNMIQAWNKEKHNLTFTIGNLNVESSSPSPYVCNVILSYTVVSHYPNGEDLSVFQRSCLVWCEVKVKDKSGNTKKLPRIVLCQITNPYGKHEDDVIYPVHYDQIYAGKDICPNKGERIYFKGSDRSDYYLLSNNILWIESITGRHCILHTTDEAIDVIATINDLAGKFPHLFVRCHQSYLINPLFVKKIQRFKVTLSNNIELPVPEKKYTSFKKQIAEMNI